MLPSVCRQSSLTSDARAFEVGPLEGCHHHSRYESKGDVHLRSSLWSRWIVDAISGGVHDRNRPLSDNYLAHYLSWLGFRCSRSGITLDILVCIWVDDRTNLRSANTRCRCSLTLRFASHHTSAGPVCHALQPAVLSSIPCEADHLGSDPALKGEANEARNERSRSKKTTLPRQLFPHGRARKLQATRTTSTR